MCSPPLPGGELNRWGTLITNSCSEGGVLIRRGAVNQIIKVSDIVQNLSYRRLSIDHQKIEKYRQV